MRLTDMSIRALQPPEKGQVTYTDDILPGFGVRVSQGGVKSFVVVYGRSRRRATLGRYPIIGLQDARKMAKELLAERTLGKPETAAINFEMALPIFLGAQYPANHPKPRTRDETERLLKRHFLAPLRFEKLGDIQTHEITRIIDGLQKTPSEARHAFVTIRQFFNWAAGRKYVAGNPLLGIETPAGSMARDRVLTKDELQKVLRHAEAIGTTFGKIVLLLAFTGQRRNEIASLRAEWIDFDKRVITLPPSITKNNRTHTLPFGPRTEEILRAGNEEDYLFPARGKETPFNGWSKAKPTFDRGCPVTHWTLHDLRRTFATNLAALGVPVHVTEKLLNHVSGTTGGIVAVYQRHAYLDEMREALLMWEKYVGTLMKRSVRTEVQ